ncbi:cytochrome P450 [Sinimarinibacterium thermocellulolyticum]|uniref:Cytochrome P450 n=1 Tax=Sinimarinibacterium thermocellulolyticum TaxID=3170016 RepID=A0ABV2ADR0_9GAMM
MEPDQIQTLMAAFDHTSEAQMRDPHPMYRAFRTQCPVGRSEQHGGFFVVSSYELVKTVFDDYARFSSTEGVGIPPHPYKMLPIDLDPPQQTKFRRVLNPRFTVESVSALAPKVEAKVHELIDAFIERGHADFAAQLVRPLLPAIVLPLLGVPMSDQPQMSAWIEYLTRGRANDLAGVAKAGEQIGAYLMGLVAARRQQPPIDDIMGLLLSSEIDGKPLSDGEIFRVLLIILFGGLDTTSAVMLEALLHLSRNPVDARRLMSGELDWARAIEEFVRYASPIQGLRRTVSEATVLGGQVLVPGDWVFGLHGSANRDPAVFKDADRCVLDRTPNPHLGFGSGAHICLGRNLARLEIRILLQTVLHRIPDYTTPSDFDPEYLAGEARGMKSLPVRFTPGRRRANVRSTEGVA